LSSFHSPEGRLVDARLRINVAETGLPGFAVESD
jgi:hypothetical protein